MQMKNAAFAWKGSLRESLICPRTGTTPLQFGALTPRIRVPKCKDLYDS